VRLLKDALRQKEIEETVFKELPARISEGFGSVRRRRFSLSLRGLTRPADASAELEPSQGGKRGRGLAFLSLSTPPVCACCRWQGLTSCRSMRLRPSPTKGSFCGSSRRRRISCSCGLISTSSARRPLARGRRRQVQLAHLPSCDYADSRPLSSRRPKPSATATARGRPSTRWSSRLRTPRSVSVGLSY
jgi:hypothetical protein